MKTDSDKWNHAVVEILQAIMNHTSSQLNIVKWGSKQLQSDHIVAVSDLQPTMLRQLCSPKISYINSHQMIVFGIRVCATDKNFSTGKWLNDDHVKLSLANYSVELNISNSTCDSGNMVTAGIILLKHPVYTHRLYFLLSLRRSLPSNTPYFDIGVHKRTHSGMASPHLVVKCGENHQETLTEILSNYMNGKTTTALYIGSRIIQSMSMEERSDLFEVHQKYVASIQRLPLAPYVVNIDRQRTETILTGSATRSTREWANSLQSTTGKPLQCDTENGDKDRKAYLLVPSHHLDQVRNLLDKYLFNIRQYRNAGNMFEQTSNRPTEIYVPTASVQRNVDFIRTMSSIDIWQNAPSAIRQAHSKPSTPYQAPVPQSASTNLPTASNTSARTSFRNDPNTPVTDNSTRNINGPQNPDAISPRTSDDNTTTTFQSNMTTINSSAGARFAELDNAIRNNKKEFQIMQNQFITIEQRMIETMETCHLNSTQMISMQGQMTTMQTHVMDLVTQMKLLTQSLSSELNTPGNSGGHQSNYMKSPEKKKQRHLNSSEVLHTQNADSPDTDITAHLFRDQPADQGDQYKSPSSPDSAMEE
jgi:hypothetical protein